LSDEDVEDVGYINFLNEVTHNSPSPDDVHNQSSAYPAAAVETPLATCCSADSAEVDADWEDEHPHEPDFVSTFSPSQRTTENERKGQTSIDRGRRDDSGLGASIAPSTPLSVAGKELHAVAQEITGLDPRFVGAQGEEEVPHTTDAYPDEAGPEFPGGVVFVQASHGPTGDIPAVADVVAAQIPPQGFPCTFVNRDTSEKCKMVCKRQNDLKYVSQAAPIEVPPRLTLPVTMFSSMTRSGHTGLSAINVGKASDTKTTSTTISMLLITASGTPVQTATRRTLGRMAWYATGEPTPLHLRRPLSLGESG
jgi:hypothetical protein